MVVKGLNNQKKQLIIKSPGREAILLVKDAIEFCENSVPFNDQRPQKTEISKVTDQEYQTAPEQLKQQIPIKEIIPSDTLQVLSDNSVEYVPQFTDSQRKQLDEQLRNVNLNILIINRRSNSKIFR